MSPDPYADQKLNVKYPCADKSIVTGKICAILDARAENRGLNLVPFPSRGVQKYEIHEIILTAELQAAPNAVVNNISYLCFFEILDGGILWAGDRVIVGGQEIGVLAGYDMTHFPNHMNIIIRIDGDLYTGLEGGFKVGMPISFVFPGRPD